MAIQTVRFFENSDGATGDLVYDDQAMTASGVLVHVPADAKAVMVSAVIGGQEINVTYPPGTDTTFSFGAPLPISYMTAPNGNQGISMPWFGSVGIAAG